MSIPGLRVALFAFVAFATISPAARAGVVNWIGTTGFWDVAGNWNPGIPQAGDSVFINVPGPQLATFRSPTAITVGSLAVGSAANLDSFAVTGGALAVTGSYTGVADTAISGGTLTLNGGSALNTFSQSNGSLGGTATVAINGTASFTFGDQRGAGTTILNGPATISGSGFRLDGGRTLQNNATLTWSAGQILFNNTFSGASGGPGSGTINNTAGGTFIASGDSATGIAASNFGGIDTGADALFVNAGTFRKSGSSALSVTTVDVSFNNAGTVDAQTGVLNLNNGGVHTGNFGAAAGAVVAFAGGTHNINGGSAVAAGTKRVSGATVNVAVPYAVAGALDIQGGTLNLAGGTTTAALTQSSGSIAGAGTLTVSGTASFTFGDHRGAGTTLLNGPATISGSGFRLDGGRTLQNNATLTWSAGQILFNNTFSGASGGPGSGTINNTAGGTFIASGDSATSIAASNFGGIDTGADALFVNAGTFRKSGSSALSVTMIGVAFNNSGTVDAQSGTIQLPDNFHNAGTLTGGGAYTTSTLTNDGHVAPGNGVGNLKLNGNFVQSPVGIVDFEFGTCALFDTLTITGTAVLSGTLHASFQGCAPVAGNTFSLVTAAGISGTFGALVVSGGPPGVAFNLTYTSNSVVLNAVVGIAPPLLNRAVSRKAHGAAGTFDLPL